MCDPPAAGQLDSFYFLHALGNMRARVRVYRTQVSFSQNGVWCYRTAVFGFAVCWCIPGSMSDGPVCGPCGVVEMGADEDDISPSGRRPMCGHHRHSDGRGPSPDEIQRCATAAQSHAKAGARGAPSGCAKHDTKGSGVRGPSSTAPLPLPTRPNQSSP